MPDGSPQAEQLLLPTIDSAGRSNQRPDDVEGVSTNAPALSAEEEALDENMKAVYEKLSSEAAGALQVQEEQLAAMAKRFDEVVTGYKQEVIALRQQVVKLTRETAEARCREAEVRQEADALRYMTRLEQSQLGEPLPAAASGTGASNDVGESADAAHVVDSARTRAKLLAATAGENNGGSVEFELRQSLLQAHQDLERTYEELQWWQDHGPQLIDRADVISVQLEQAHARIANSDRALAEVSRQLADVQSSARLSEQRCTKSDTELKAAEAREKVMRESHAQMEAAVKAMQVAQRAAADREQRSHADRIRLAIALGLQPAARAELTEFRDAEAADVDVHSSFWLPGELSLGVLADRAEDLQEAEQEKAEQETKERMAREAPSDDGMNRNDSATAESERDGEGKDVASQPEPVAVTTGVHKCIANAGVTATLEVGGGATSSSPSTSHGRNKHVMAMLPAGTVVDIVELATGTDGRTRGRIAPLPPPLLPPALAKAGGWVSFLSTSGKLMLIPTSSSPQGPAPAGSRPSASADVGKTPAIVATLPSGSADSSASTPSARRHQSPGPQGTPQSLSGHRTTTHGDGNFETASLPPSEDALAVESSAKSARQYSRSTTPEKVSHFANIDHIGQVLSPSRLRGNNVEAQVDKLSVPRTSPHITRQLLLTLSEL
eukprot:SAG31_NODE_3700_length_3975_cov_36.979102_2_plen_668_part_00